MTSAVDRMLSHSKELAVWFKNYEPTNDQKSDPMAVAELCGAVFQRADAEQQLISAIKRGREAGFSWQKIGKLVGTTGEAARQRYASKVE